MNRSNGHRRNGHRKKKAAVALSAAALKDAERRQRAWAMRVAGLDVFRIARLLDAPPEQIERDLRGTLKELNRKETMLAKTCRILENARLDEVNRALWRHLGNADLSPEQCAVIARAVITLSERRCRMLAVDLARSAAPDDLVGMIRSVLAVVLLRHFLQLAVPVDRIAVIGADVERAIESAIQGRLPEPNEAMEPE
jgi:hypothetical protein